MKSKITSKTIFFKLSILIKYVFVLINFCLKDQNQQHSDCIKFILTLSKHKQNKLSSHKQRNLLIKPKQPLQNSTKAPMTSRTRYLVDDLNRTHDSFYKTQRNPQESFQQSFLKPRKKQSFATRLTQQKTIAKHKYEGLTNMTKQQQRQMVWNQMQSSKKLKKQWTHSYYMGNNKLPHASKTFGIYDNKYLEEFPDNNTKYNVQFLDRSLHGTNLKFPRSESGEFKKPSNNLYSKHYKPIVKEKVKFNQDWELRTSLFEKTWVDYKRDRIMTKYELQTNPFKTPRSNSLISQMSKSQMY